MVAGDRNFKISLGAVKMNALLVLATIIGQAAAVSAQSAAVSRDTIYVRGSAPPVWGPNVRITQVFSIGRENGPPEYAFGVIDAFAVDRRGRFYLYDRDDKQIRAYDASGRFVRLIGRAGEGPSEYQNVLGLDIVGDTLLAVFDEGSQRAQLFTPEGKVQRTLQSRRLYNINGLHALGADREGRVYSRVQMFGSGMDNAEAPVGNVNEQWLVYAPTGGLSDSIRIPMHEPRPRPFSISTAEREVTNFVNVVLSASSPASGIVFGDNNAYRFVIKPLRGPAIVVERAWTPVAVGVEEMANFQEWVDYYRRQGGRILEIPRAKPAYDDLFADRDGRIWVSIYAAAERRNTPARAAGDTRPRLIWRQRATYDVFDKAGVYQGRITLPPNARLLNAQGDKMWVLAKGTDDVESVVLYQIVR
jgi:hypothetical protein